MTSSIQDHSIFQFQYLFVTVYAGCKMCIKMRFAIKQQKTIGCHGVL